MRSMKSQVTQNEPLTRSIRTVDNERHWNIKILEKKTSGKITQEFDELSEIDNMSFNEFVDGNQALNDSDDGIQITVGSDDEFTIDEQQPNSEQDTVEPGELQSSSEDDDEQNLHVQVASKVVKKHQPKVSQKENLVGDISSSSPRVDKFSYLRHDPDFKKFLNEMFNERSGKKGEFSVEERQNEEQSRQKRNDKKGKGNSLKEIIKSPSDTTIYSPALRRMSNEDVSLIEKISNFVESIRLDGKNSLKIRKRKF